jgi:Lon protease-like protein
MNLVTVGRERFRILNAIRERGYLEAEVELLPEETPGELVDLPGQVRQATERYVNGLRALHGEPERSLPLPQDARLLSYFVGAVLQAPLPVRQELLEKNVVAERLSGQLTLLRRETESLEEQHRAGGIRPYPAGPGRVSLN